VLEAALAQPALKNMKTFDSVDDRVEYLKDQIDTSVGKRDGLITAELESPFPDEARQIMASVVDAYLAFQSAQKRSTAGEVVKVLRSEREKQVADLAAMAQKLNEFKRQHVGMSLEMKSQKDEADGSIVMKRYAMLCQALTEAQIATLAARAEYAEAKRLVPPPPPQSSQGNIATFDPAPDAFALEDRNEEALQLELSRWQQQRRVLQRQYGADHPQILNADAQVRYLRAAYAHTLDRRVQMLEGKEAALRNEIAQLQKVALDINAQAGEYAQLEADARRIERSVDVLDAQIKEMAVAENAGSVNVKVLEAAAISADPYQPEQGSDAGHHARVGPAHRIGRGAGSGAAGPTVAFRRRSDCRAGSSGHRNDPAGFGQPGAGSKRAEGALGIALACRRRLPQRPDGGLLGCA
jgi:uncharacterized protein involved in exopolysaccharide biosynthesis